MIEDHHPNFQREKFSKLPMTKECEFCGELADIVVHAFCETGHCEKRRCVDMCEACQDWITAVVEGAPPEPKTKKKGKEMRDWPKRGEQELYPSSLTEEESNHGTMIGRRIAAKRTADKRAFQGEENRVGNHILGAKGEIVTRKELGMPTGIEVFEQGGDGGKNDILLPSGRHISVKTVGAFYKDWFFGVNDLSRMKDDYGVLVGPAYEDAGKPPDQIQNFVIVGWFTREEWIQNSEPWKVSWGTARRITDKKMHDFRELLAIEGRKEKEEGK